MRFFAELALASLRVRDVSSVYREVIAKGVCTVGVLDTFFLRVAAEKHSN